MRGARGRPLPKLGDLIELTRAPAALSVPGDALAGAAASGWPFGWATAGVTGSSVLLYWAGMALNDYADREIDARERPGRPIPSGRVRPGFALGLATGLTAAGIAAAALTGGRRAGAVAVPLAATVWAYDLALKSTVAGPAAMAAARGLDVLLGAGGRRTAAAPAVLVAAHTLAITMLSRHEVTGSDRRPPAATLAATGAVGLAAALSRARPRHRWAPGARRRTAGPPAIPTTRPAGSGCVGSSAASHLRRAVAAAEPARRAAMAGLLGCYLTTFGRAQIAAVADPSAERIQRAVGAGILGMIPLQASLVARTGALPAAAMVAAGFPLARRLSRKVSPT